MKSPDHTWIALVDCNNFFVSCERLFRPDLTNKPVVVLSSNDGCIVARSPEVKEMGIPMGAPYFQVKDVLNQKDVVIFSSNFHLYRNISRRVMSIVTSHSERTHIYSIDEAFFELSGSEKAVRENARALKRYLERATGIPVSIGIARTKTLAKCANDYAKKHKQVNGIFCISHTNRRSVLKNTSVSDVWGIGGKTALKLKQRRITNAFDLSITDTQQLRSALGLHTARTALELQEVLCFPVSEQTSEKKGILTSRSFGKKTDNFEKVFKAVSRHVHEASKKLRAQHQAAQYVSVTVRTSRHGNLSKTISGQRELLSPTSDTFELLNAAEDIFKEIFLPGFQYAKAGIFLSDLLPAERIPERSLFGTSDHHKHKRLMEVLDSLSAQFGSQALYPAALGTHRSTEPRSESRSPDYTVSWHALPIVRAR